MANDGGVSSDAECTPLALPVDVAHVSAHRYGEFLLDVQAASVRKVAGSRTTSERGGGARRRRGTRCREVPDSPSRCP